MSSQLFLVPLLACAGASAQHEWSARYACYPNITDQQKAEGMLPAWNVQVRQEEGIEVVALDGDDDGKCVGHVYIGRPCALPPQRPASVQLSLELQAWDDVRDRTPGVEVMLLARSAWERLSTTPADCTPPPVWKLGEVVANGTVSYPSDTREWHRWTSGNLVSRISRATPGELMAVIHFMGPQGHGREYARFRGLEIKLSSELPVVRRERRWPLKDRQMLLTPAEIATARARLAEQSEAKVLLDSIMPSCRQWLEVPDADLAWRLPDASVPRAFNISAKGSPTIGTRVYQKGTYPWILRFDRPFTIECPITGEVYPGNDFAAWYRGGRRDKSLLQGQYADDGWGWTGPDGERHWFVAYANLWTWSKFILPGVTNLSRAYVLTGDRSYAHKAAAMLARIADIYPAMEYESQSRYGTFHPNYLGKIQYHTWECFTTQQLAEAYDNIWDSIDGDTVLQRNRGQSGQEIREHIETNLLQEAIDAVLCRRIEGNYGMHQRALALLVAARQNCLAEELLRTFLDGTGGEGPYEGVCFALYNWVHRDGFPYESSPGYSFSWVDNLTGMAQVLQPSGIDLYAEPQFRRLVQWPIDIIVNGKHTPALGDSGDQRHGIVGRDYEVYREAFARYGGADLAWMLEQCGGKSALRTYHDLFREPLQERLEQALQQPRPVPRSRVLDGFGMALLNNPADTIGLMCFYGWRGSHRHLDGLHFDLYAHGKALTPDTGYPDFMNDRVPGIFSWSQATISHNTVTVDARQQTGNPEGQVRRAAFGDCVQYCDLDANGNYPQTGVYRRALALVATAADQAYLLDVFRVTGGGRHDYSLHGATGECTVLQGDFGEPQKGTLAGEDVAVGELYDEPSMAGKDYEGGYSAYRGSGYQHFVNARHQAGIGNVVLQFKPDEPPAVQLRMHLLPREPQRVILANAQVSPIKRPALLPYAIVRAEGQDLKSVFVSVLEPFTAEPFIRNVEVLFATADAVAVRVERRDSVDLLLQANDDGTMRAAGDAVVTDAAFAAVTVGADGRLQRAVAAGGTRLLAAGEELPLRQPARGRIAAVDPAANAVVVTWQGESPAPAALVGRDLLFRNDRRNSMFRVSAADPVADGLRLVLRESVLNGRGRVTRVDEAAKAIETDSRMLFQAKYAGMRAVSEDYRGYLPILSAASGRFALAANEPLATVFSDSDGDGRTGFWVSVLGPGDAVELQGITEIRRQ